MWRKFSKIFYQNTCTRKASFTVYQEDKWYKEYTLKISCRIPRRILSPLLSLPIVYKWENPLLSCVKFKKCDPKKRKKKSLAHQNYSLKNILHFLYRNPVILISLSLSNLWTSHPCSLTLGSFGIWWINMAHYTKDWKIFCYYAKEIVL